MASVCPICYKETDGNGGVRVRKQNEEKFFRLFLRYLNGVEEPGMEIQSHNHFSGVGMLTCGQCMSLMESFCELYHQLKTTELLINWKVETLKKVMRSAQSVPSRMNNMQNVRRRVETPEQFEGLIKARKWLLKKCSQKQTIDFPTLSIEKWRSNEVAAFTKLGHLEKGKSTGNTIFGIAHIQKNQLDTPSSPVSGNAESDEIPSEPYDEKDMVSMTSIQKKVAVDTTVLTNSDDGAANTNDITDVGETSFADTNQIGAHPDDDDVNRPLSTHGNDQGFIRDDGYSEVLLPPSPIQAQASDSLLKSEPSQVKIEYSDRSVPGLERDVEFHCNGLDDVIQIQLRNPTEPPTDFGSSATNLIPDEPHTKRVSRLRPTYQCRHCGRTFSTDARLQLHIGEDHQNDESNNEGLASNSDDNDQVEDCDIPMDIDSSSLSSSSSDEQDDNLESDDGHSYTVVQTNEKRSKKFLPVPITRQEAQLRFKCPDCKILFADMKALLRHRKTSKSCAQPYDPTASIKVEVLTLSKNSKTEASLNTSNFINVFAVVDLPQEIYICDSCDLAVYTFEDMETHKKLHASFRCNYCDVSEDYAPYLAIHENRDHFPKKRADGKRHKLGYNCPRCAFGCNLRNEYVAHHLSEHLTLTFNEPQCPICKKTAMTDYNPKTWKKIRFQIGTHLKTHHDLNNVTNEDDRRKCNLENCSAYFLTAAQLTEHQTIRHGLEAPTRFKWSIIHSHSTIQTNYRLKCPDCDDLFCSPEEILTHRKTSKSCSSSWDPSKSVKVEVFVPPDEPRNKNEDGDETVFTTVHAIIDIPQAIFVCDIEHCGAVQYAAEDMETHKQLHGSFPCKFCEAKLSSAPKLSIHELQHFKKEKSDKGSNTGSFHFCPRCDFKCDNRCSYIRHHMITHLSLTVNEPVCPICKTHALDLSRTASKQTSHFKDMHDLSNVTIPEDILHCTVPSCNAYFLFPNQLTEHLSYRHNIRDRRYSRYETSPNPSKQRSKRYKTGIAGEPLKKGQSHECRDCGKTYAILRELWVHRVKHHVDPDKAIQCTVPKCKKVFESTKQLEHHIKFAAPYHKSLTLGCPDVQCPKCDRSIRGSNPSFLAIHLRTHERVLSPFCCELCGKVFKDKCRLQIHYKSHSGPESWKFECSVCSKKCLTKQKLDEHTRIHTQDKPFVCEICGAKYAHRHNLRIHVKNTHGDEMEDKAKRSNKANSTTKKATKRKRTNDVESVLDADKPDSDSDTN